jgi:hypothetical protein
MENTTILNQVAILANPFSRATGSEPHRMKSSLETNTFFDETMVRISMGFSCGLDDRRSGLRFLSPDAIIQNLAYCLDDLLDAHFTYSADFYKSGLIFPGQRGGFLFKFSAELDGHPPSFATMASTSSMGISVICPSSILAA